jgi:hypothetical protein
MRKVIKYYLNSLLLVFCLATSVYSQVGTSQLSEKEKFSVIKKAISLLQENYIFPDKVATVEKHLISKFNAKGYEANKNPKDFLIALNNDLEKETNDKHVNISYGPDRVKQIISEKLNEGKTVPLTKEWLERLKYENFRLRKVEWLVGNIGYFKFLNFPDLQAAKESIVGAMNFISNSNAIIIDLRDNGGGSSETLKFILSYFLRDGLKIGEFHYRKNNRIEEIIIPSDPAIKKFPDNIPVYILVSSRTSSAAEGMASVLQALKRAVIVGENTKGEGNPGELFVINEQLYIMIPTAISKSAFANAKSVEGIGVSPDFFITPEKSFDKAMLEICITLAQNTPDKQLKQIYEWQIPLWEYNLNPLPTPMEFKENIVGNFKDNRQIEFENGNYFYVNSDKTRMKLSYYGNNIFGIEGKQFVRLRISPNESPISYFEFFWDDGSVERIPRTN